jgi:hypothetical protein
MVSTDDAVLIIKPPRAPGRITRGCSDAAGEAKRSAAGFAARKEDSALRIAAGASAAGAKAAAGPAKTAREHTMTAAVLAERIGETGPFSFSALGSALMVKVFF